MPENYEKKLWRQSDLLRAQARSTSPQNMMEATRMMCLRDLQQTIRPLAETFEREGKFDEASAVYYNLAFLPSANTIKNADGSEQIVGFTNGYSAYNPQRDADFDHAVVLNRSTPQVLEYQSQTAAKTKNLQSRSSELYREPTAQSETIVRKNPDRAWSQTYRTIFRRYLALNKLNEMCIALKVVYKFEPTFKCQKLLASDIQDCNKARVEYGQTALDCKLDF